MLVTNDALFIHDEVRPLSQTALPVEHPVGFDRLEIGIIAYQGKVELQKINKGRLRENRVGADPYNFSIRFFKLVVVVPTGRQFLDSSGSKIEDVKFEHDVFHSLKAAQLELASLSAGQFKVRGFVSYLDGRGDW